MIRKLVLGLSILAIIAVPLPAWARNEQGPEFHGRPEFHGQERFERRDHRPSVGFYYAPVCGWLPGYWAQQASVDAYGNWSAQPQWVPPQYVCA